MSGYWGADALNSVSATLTGRIWFQFVQFGVESDLEEVFFCGFRCAGLRGGEAIAAMMRTVWLGSSASRSLLPSLHLHQFSAPRCRVQCSADVHAMKLVEQEYAELELNAIQVCFLSQALRHPLSGF